MSAGEGLLSRSRAHAIHPAPAERIKLPPELDGSHGPFRCHAEIAGAPVNDLEALAAWTRTLNAESLLPMRSALDQFLCWCVRTREKPLSSINDSDLEAYEEFLQAIQPAKDWICVQGVDRSDPAWRPFSRSQLAPATRKLKFAAIRAAIVWMRETLYADPPCFRQHGRRQPSGTKRVAPEPLQTITPIGLTAMGWIWKALAFDRQLCSSVRRTLMLLKYFCCLDNRDIFALVATDFSKAEGLWYLHAIAARPLNRTILLLPPVVDDLTQLGFLVEEGGEQKSPSSATPNRLYGGSVSGIDKHLRKTLLQASDLASAHDADAGMQLRGFKRTWLRYALSAHAGETSAGGPRAQSLARSVVGAQPAPHTSRTPSYLLPAMRSQTHALSLEATEALRFVWSGV